MGELIPDTIDVLMAIATDLQANGNQLAALPPHVKRPQILDGADVAAITGCYLAIGVDGEDDIAGSDSVAQAGLGGRRTQDSASVTCLAFASGGNSDMKPYRDAAYAWYRALRNAVEKDRRLRGTVAFAAVTSEVYRPKRSGSAAGAGVEFRVQVTAL